MKIPILALDVALSTGFAFVSGGDIESGLASFAPVKGESPGMRFLKFEQWLEEMITTRKPRVVAYERPAHFWSIAAAASLHGQIAIMQKLTVKHAAELMPVQTGKLKKHATGFGNAKKPQMQCAARWYYPDEYGAKEEAADAKGDHADALCVMRWALEDLRVIPKQKDPPLFPPIVKTFKLRKIK